MNAIRRLVTCSSLFWLLALPAGKTCQAANMEAAYVGAVDVFSSLLGQLTNCTPASYNLADGMPVLLNVPINETTMEPGQFAITVGTTVVHPDCATLAPADGEKEGHTILLTGNFLAADRLPTRVEIVVPASGQALLSKGGMDLTGLSTGDIRAGFRDGLSLALAFWYPNQGENGQVQAIFDGGVSGYRASDVTDDMLMNFSLIDTEGKKFHPIAVGDDDGDNYLMLTIPPDFNEMPVSLEIDSSVLYDPFNYPNNPGSVLVQVQGVNEENPMDDEDRMDLSSGAFTLFCLASRASFRSFPVLLTSLMLLI